MVDQRPHVVRHALGVIVGRIVELGRLAVAAIVERDHAAAGARERRDPARLHPVHLLVGRKAVHQDDRLALPFIEKRNLHRPVTKARHACR